MREEPKAPEITSTELESGQLSRSDKSECTCVVPEETYLEEVIDTGASREVHDKLASACDILSFGDERFPFEDPNQHSHAI